MKIGHAAPEDEALSEQRRLEKQRRMTTEPVEKLIGKLAFPTIVSMMVTTFYNMADTYFVGQLQDTSMTGAVGVAFAVMAVIQAIGFFFGHGSGNFISRSLGAGKIRESEHMASVGFFSALGVGALLAVLGLIFCDPLAWLLGSTPTIQPYAVEYLRYILAGAPLMIGAIVLNNQLRFQSNAFYSMIGLASGAVLNLLLDPLFIFQFGMGVAGAALATSLSQAVSFVILLMGLLRSDSMRLSLRNYRFQKFYYLEILRGGLPSLFRQGLSSVASICLNTAARIWCDPLFTDDAIAALAIVSKIMGFASSALIGFGQGFQPVCGFNYGAARYDRVRRAFFFCLKVATAALIVLSLIGIWISPYLIELFQNDPETVKIGTQALRLQLLTFPAMSFVILSNMMLQTVGKVLPASVLAMARQGLAFIPAVWILPVIWGVEGILLAQPVADLLSLAIALPLQLCELKRMRQLSPSL